jgi:VanZ family protein
MRNRVRLAVAWTFCLVALCLIPGRWLPRHERAPSSFHIPHLDKVIHFGLFAVWGLLWMRTSVTPRIAVKVLMFGLGLAIATEFAQGLPLIDRDPDVLDALADSLGVLAGVVTVRVAWPQRQPAPDSSTD